MTGLREVQLVSRLAFVTPQTGQTVHKSSSPSLLETTAVRGMSAILALQESIRADARLIYGAGEHAKKEIRRHLAPYVDHILRADFDVQGLLEEYDDKLAAISSPQGARSGDPLSHASCIESRCVGDGQNSGCVNSKLSGGMVKAIEPESNRKPPGGGVAKAVEPEGSGRRRSYWPFRSRK